MNFLFLTIKYIHYLNKYILTNILFFINFLQRYIIIIEGNSIFPMYKLHKTDIFHLQNEFSTNILF